MWCEWLVGLQVNCTLTSVDLGNNNIDNEGAALIGDALKVIGVAIIVMWRERACACRSTARSLDSTSMTTVLTTKDQQ